MKIIQENLMYNSMYIHYYKIREKNGVWYLQSRLEEETTTRNCKRKWKIKKRKENETAAISS